MLFRSWKRGEREPSSLGQNRSLEQGVGHGLGLGQGLKFGLGLGLGISLSALRIGMGQETGLGLGLCPGLGISLGLGLGFRSKLGAELLGSSLTSIGSGPKMMSGTGSELGSSVGLGLEQGLGVGLGLDLMSLETESGVTLLSSSTGRTDSLTPVDEGRDERENR